jgi:hypothetical protein
MANIQKYLEEFDEAIKLRRYHENSTLAEKRERVLRTLSDGLKELRRQGKQIPSYRAFNQGSYDLGVGVKPLDGDYDIDVGIAFDLSRGEHEPVAIKQWVLDAVHGHTKNVRMRSNCVTVFYERGGEAAYHVDLAIYADRPKNGGRVFLARGKAGSKAENCVWSLSDPEGLTDRINERFSGDDARQFRRVIRALKRWKDEQFSGEGNAAPRGIALTVAAYQSFVPARRLVDGEDRPDDLAALRSLVGAVLRGFGARLTVTCPAEPFDDLCGRMTALQMKDFKAKLEALLDALRAAADDADPHEACKAMWRQFGDDFPVPAKEDTGKPQRRAVTSSGNSG